MQHSSAAAAGSPPAPPPCLRPAAPAPPDLAGRSGCTCRQQQCEGGGSELLPVRVAGQGAGSARSCHCLPVLQQEGLLGRRLARRRALPAVGQRQQAVHAPCDREGRASGERWPVRHGGELQFQSRCSAASPRRLTCSAELPRCLAPSLHHVKQQHEAVPLRERRHAQLAACGCRWIGRGGGLGLAVAAGISGKRSGTSQLPHPPE